MTLELSSLTVGPFQENCYLLHSGTGGQAVLIDPGDEPERIWQMIEQSEARLVAILLTHAHLDHVAALTGIRERAAVPVYLHPADDALLAEAPLYWAQFGRQLPPIAPAEHALDDGQLLDFGFVQLQVIHTPGHTPGGVCFWAEREDVLIAGDTLFFRGIGRADLPGGDQLTLLRSIRTRLFTLPGDQRRIAVYPGHGPPSVLADERRLNPFVGEGGMLA
jgi:hydroxyacylglutathione hydrolase